MTMNYAIDDAQGNRLTAGLPENRARQVAQRMANERREPVYLYGIGIHEDGPTTEVRPELQIDAAMCGGEFTGDVARVAEYLTDHGYPAVAVTDSVNGASNLIPVDETVPEAVWLAALEAGEENPNDLDADELEPLA